MMVQSPDPGIEIYVRNKRPADMTAFRPERTVLFVHGATYPAHDRVRSQARWPVVDGLHRGARLRRLSPRPSRLRQIDPAEGDVASRPRQSADRARRRPRCKDIGAVVDFILKRRNIPRLNLLGWSWGTTLMATYTTQNPDKVERLVLYAPVWIRKTPRWCRPAPARSAPTAR